MFPSPEHRGVFLTTLRTLGVAKLIVNFSGGGDSGDIESVDAYNADMKTEIPLTTQIPWSSDGNYFNMNKGTWEKRTKEEVMTLEKIAKELTFKALEDQGLDWYNNDGGQGTLEIDFSTSPPTIQLDVGINYTSVEEHSFNLNEE
jgi:hypothetical protein